MEEREGRGGMRWKPQRGVEVEKKWWQRRNRCMPLAAARAMPRRLLASCIYDTTGILFFTCHDWSFPIDAWAHEPRRGTQLTRWSATLRTHVLCLISKFSNPEVPGMLFIISNLAKTVRDTNTATYFPYSMSLYIYVAKLCC